MNAQTFFTPTTYIGAFPVTDNTPATDWTDGWTNWDPGTTNYPATTVTVNANITTNTTWTSNNVYHLVGNVAVTGGAVLTIQPGTIIRGDKTTKSVLIITKGSKIIAQGTSSQPIVFTSNEAAGNRDYGDWGGIVILGNGIINTPGTSASCTGCGTNPNINMIEGFASYDAVQLYGGTDNNDSSGVFSYCRIEFSGVALSSTANSEINGLTMGGVGSKTKIDHVMVSFNGDDAFEWFGGAVNAKYLIAYRTWDDDMDTDFGWKGRVQFGLIVRDPNSADQSKSESFESDNYNPGVGRTPLTQGIFSNITIVGPKRDGTVTPGSNLFLCGAQIRRNSAQSIFNSIFTGWPVGLQVAGSATQDNYTQDSCAFGNNWIIGATNAIDVSSGGSAQSFYATFFGTKNNDSTKTNANVNWVNAFPANLETKPDFRLNSSSQAATAASFNYSQFQGITLSNQNIAQMINELQLYPNPASEFITLSVNFNDASNIAVNIYDITGKLVANPVAEGKSKSVNKIDISILPAGVYFATVSSEYNSKTMKFVVAK